MNDQAEKICPLCAEPIKATAKLCPFCRADQRSGAFVAPLVPWLGFAVMLLIIAGAATLFYRVIFSGRDFNPIRAQVVVVSSEMQFSSGEKGRYVTTIGVITNGSNYAWKEVQLETRYFNQQGKLVDVGSQWFSELTIRAHAESAFRIRTLADQPETAYASHQVFVRTAKDINRWP